jgi:tritrans,polycis-undecaprenyl-diphosphate synthase [geranylgeranyl-diphosphate specific]
VGVFKLSRAVVESLIVPLGNWLLKPIYKLYERWLWLQIKNGPFPRHVGIIPDGNRRWARERGLNPTSGHYYGYVKMKEVLKWIWELRIPYVTLFAMSTENCLHRSPEEKSNLFKLIKSGLEELMNLEEVYKNKVKILVVGNLSLVPEDLRKTAEELVNATSTHDRYVLTIALCYGGRQEIIEAVKKLSRDVALGLVKPDEITEEVFIKYLPTGIIPDLDLIIRTSGEERISNFLLWHSAYSELYFCDVYWPEFRKIDFWRAIRSYQRRERRFGR